jgi:hypothetical protein
VPVATVYVHVREPGGDSDGDELALLPAGRLDRYGHGLPIGLTSQTTRKPATNTAIAARSGPRQLDGARSLTTRGRVANGSGSRRTPGIRPRRRGCGPARLRR